MSNETTTPAASPVYTVGEGENAVTKPSFVQRVVTPIKKHKKLAIAAAAGAGLVAVSAFAGRKSAQYDVLVELQPSDDEPVETVVLVDTSSSDE